MTEKKDDLEDISGLKLPLLMFSGGLDSTYTLLKTLETSHCDVLYVNGGQGQEKIEAESKAMLDIQAFMAKHSRHHRVRNVYRVNVSLDYTRNNGPRMFNVPRSTKFSQPLYWLNGALMVVDSDIHSRLEMSYVCGDQMMYHVGDLSQAWLSLQAFTIEGDAIPVNFPLRYMKKRDLLKRMPPGLIALTWWCELPKKKYLEPEQPGPDFVGTDISIGDGEPPKRYKYVTCGECAACVNAREAFAGTDAGTQDEFMRLQYLAEADGRFDHQPKLTPASIE